jgi:aldose 1-epimerase
VIRLAAGDWRATLRPDLGGAVASLCWRGEDVLRPTLDDADDPLQTACFPLVPYANRIDGGRFVFAGETVQLTPTPGFEPHALHGDGWRKQWSVEEADEASAVMTLTHPRGDWPWAWSARQTVRLTETGLAIELALTNVDKRSMPAGLGLHPYFLRTHGVELAFRSEGVWETDERLIPIRLSPRGAVFDWTEGRRVDQAPFVDHAYDGWDGVAVLTDPGRTITLRASPNARCAHVYAPSGQTFLCVEPMTHRPNAMNAPAGETDTMPVLQPGETATVTLTITAA